MGTQLATLEKIFSNSQYQTEVAEIRDLDGALNFCNDKLSNEGQPLTRQDLEKALEEYIVSSRGELDNNQLMSIHGGKSKGGGGSSRTALFCSTNSDGFLCG
jgi:hypothetical protein